MSPSHFRQALRRVRTTSGGSDLHAGLGEDPEPRQVCQVKPRSSAAAVVPSPVGAVNEDGTKDSGASEAERL